MPGLNFKVGNGESMGKDQRGTGMVQPKQEKVTVGM